MTIPGSGPSLIEATPSLRDAEERHRRILDVAERNSVVEGLPPFSPVVRQDILAELRRLSAPDPAPQKSAS